MSDTFLAYGDKVAEFKEKPGYADGASGLAVAGDLFDKVTARASDRVFLEYVPFSRGHRRGSEQRLTPIAAVPKSSLTIQSVKTPWRKPVSGTAAVLLQPPSLALALGRCNTLRSRNAIFQVYTYLKA